MKGKQKLSIIWAILAAALYGVSAPFSKLLLQYISPTLMAAFLYLGAGMGMYILKIFRSKLTGIPQEQVLTKKEIPYTVGMVVLDIAAPILLMVGLTKTTSANASLLNNFEIVSTALIALLIFHETIHKKLWIAIGLITFSSMILSFVDSSSLSFSTGSLLVILACVCWGFENNCTRMLSLKDPMQIVMIKGIGSGLGSFLIALITGEELTSVKYMVFALLMGFLSYGLSIFFYVYAQRELGAAKTSTYYALAPFIGAILSSLLFKEIPSLSFAIAFLFMIVGTYFVSSDSKTKLNY